MQINKSPSLNIPQVCLASNSKIRAKILQQAGLDITIFPADIDENVWKISTMVDPCKLAQTLAYQKAKNVREKVDAQWVIGCDQVIHLNGNNYSKPKNSDEMKQQLTKFSGKKVSYISGLCIYQNNHFIHKSVEHNYVEFLVMTDTFIDNFVNKYIDELGCAGVAPMEGIGMQIVASMQGSLFSIMGMPIYKLLHVIRGYS